jgi:hypothetical protein
MSHFFEERLHQKRGAISNGMLFLLDQIDFVLNCTAQSDFKIWLCLGEQVVAASIFNSAINSLLGPEITRTSRFLVTSRTPVIFRRPDLVLGGHSNPASGQAWIYMMIEHFTNMSSLYFGACPEGEFEWPHRNSHLRSKTTRTVMYGSSQEFRVIWALWRSIDQELEILTKVLSSCNYLLLKKCFLVDQT